MKLFLLFALALPSFGAYPNGYTYRRTITIDHTKVPNTDQTDFPVVICLNGATSPCSNAGLVAADLKTVGNGGQVQNTVSISAPYTHTVPADLIITSDGSGSTILNFYEQSYVASTGEMQIRVKIPSLTTAADTVVYLFYGNSSVTTFQGNVTGTWNSGYKAVLDLSDGTTLSVKDSTSNGNDATNVSSTATAGQIDGGINMASSQGASFTGITDLSGYTNGSISFLAYNTAAYNDGVMHVAVSQYGGGAQELVIMKFSNGNWYAGWNSTSGGDDRVVVAASSGNFPSSTWFHVGLTWTDTGTTTFYINGASIGTQGSTTVKFVSDALKLGYNTNYPGDWQGKVDEFRLSNALRSADWIAAEYNNEIAPQTFMTIGGATTFSASSSPRRAVIL